MSPRTVRGAAALAGLGPVRVALALGASVGLHWGALQVLGDGPERIPPSRPAEARIVLAALGASTVDVGGASAAPERAAPRGAQSGPERAPPRAAVTEAPHAAAAARGEAARTVAPRAPDHDGERGPGTLPPVRVAAARGDPAAAPRDEPVFLEAWEVDHPPEFLVAPDGLDALPELAGASTELRVALRVDATGRRVALEVDAGALAPEAAARLVRGVEDAFEDVAFMPARRDGRPVPAVMRWTVALDPKAPIALGFRLQN